MYPHLALSASRNDCAITWSPAEGSVPSVEPRAFGLPSQDVTEAPKIALSGYTSDGGEVVAGETWISGIFSAIAPEAIER